MGGASKNWEEGVTAGFADGGSACCCTDALSSPCFRPLKINRANYWPANRRSYHRLVVNGEGTLAPFMPDVARLRAAAEAFRRRPKIARTQEQIGHELAELRQVCDLIELEFSDLASEFASTNEYDLQVSTAPSPGSRRCATCLAGRLLIGFARAISYSA